jgi:hypothetical protein
MVAMKSACGFPLHTKRQISAHAGIDMCTNRDFLHMFLRHVHGMLKREGHRLRGGQAIRQAGDGRAEGR